MVFKVLDPVQGPENFVEELLISDIDDDHLLAKSVDDCFLAHVEREELAGFAHLVHSHLEFGVTERENFEFSVVISEADEKELRVNLVNLADFLAEQLRDHLLSVK